MTTPLAQALRAQELVRGGMSQRKTALEVGISRGTVASIVHGRWREAGLRRVAEQGPDPGPAGPFVRCDGCGHKVQLPCQVCRARAAIAAGPRPHENGQEDESDLALDLTGDADRRRLKLRLEKQLRGELANPLENVVEIEPPESAQ